MKKLLSVLLLFLLGVNGALFWQSHKKAGRDDCGQTCLLTKKGNNGTGTMVVPFTTSFHGLINHLSI